MCFFFYSKPEQASRKVKIAVWFVTQKAAVNNDIARGTSHPLFSENTKRNSLNQLFFPCTGKASVVCFLFCLVFFYRFGTVRPLSSLLCNVTKMLHLCVTKTFTTLYKSNILIVQFHNKNKNSWTKQPPPEAFSHAFFFSSQYYSVSMAVWDYSEYARMVLFMRLVSGGAFSSGRHWPGWGTTPWNVSCARGVMARIKAKLVSTLHQPLIRIRTHD